MKYIVANWKANKNLYEAESWITEFLKLYQPYPDRIIVICTPFPFLLAIKQKINEVKGLKLGVQDLSGFEEGAVTGETTAKSLQGLAEYAIVGHSERRKNFGETNEIIAKKISLAKKYRIEPIHCIRDQNDYLPDAGVKIIAYEPPASIGTGLNEPVDRVIELKNKLNLPLEVSYLYGGSVSEKNVKDYLQSDKINGLLVGGASLNPQSFYKILE